jgi:hypothetical protein
MRVRRAPGETSALILGWSLVLLDDAEAIR